jgi:GNAT superfamily N-acetyltransferase
MSPLRAGFGTLRNTGGQFPNATLHDYFNLTALKLKHKLFLSRTAIKTNGMLAGILLGVDPDYQHKGIGEQLINEFPGTQPLMSVRNWRGLPEIRHPLTFPY